MKNKCSNPYCPHAEDAESWRIYYEGGLNGLMDIKERLIKRIELRRTKELDCFELQKILGKK